MFHACLRKVLQHGAGVCWRSIFISVSIPKTIYSIGVGYLKDETIKTANEFDETFSEDATFNKLYHCIYSFSFRFVFLKL